MVRFPIAGERLGQGARVDRRKVRVGFRFAVQKSSPHFARRERHTGRFTNRISGYLHRNTRLMRVACSARMNHLKGLLSAFSDRFFLCHPEPIGQAPQIHNEKNDAARILEYFAYSIWNHGVPDLY